MNKTCVFFGHREFLIKEEELKQRIKVAAEDLIKKGVVNFMMGMKGDFDRLALSVCRELRKIYKHIKIQVVFTNMNLTKKDFGFSTLDAYGDVETLMFPIDDIYFKQQITASNKMMVESSNFIICYIDFRKHRSGAKDAVKYALKKEKEVMFLYKNSDDPFYNLKEEEIEKMKKEFLLKIKTQI